MVRERFAFAPIVSLLIAAIAIAVANSAIGKPVTDALSVFLTPMQQLLASAVAPAGTLIGNLQDLGALRADNDRLRSAVDQLNGEVVRLREVEVENERLRSMLDSRRRLPEYQLTAATIIALDPSSPVRAATIDQGADAGLKEGMVALSPAGNLVGRIVQVRPTSARIQFIVDSSSAVNAVVQRNDVRALGIVNGLGGERLIMRYLAQQDPIRAGDVVVTSGLGGLYPRGLFIGQIVELKRNDSDVFQEARIEPSVKFSRLDTVQIIKNFVPRSLD